MHHPTDRIAHTTAFVTPVVEHWLEREIAQWVSYTKAVFMSTKVYRIISPLICMPTHTYRVISPLVAMLTRNPGMEQIFLYSYFLICQLEQILLDRELSVT